MLEDILQESPFYQRILHQGEEKGLKEGLEKGKVQGLEKMRQSVLGIVQARFPELARLAKKQVAVVDDLDILRELIINLSLARDEAEAKQKLLKVVEEDQVMDRDASHADS